MGGVYLGGHFLLDAPNPVGEVLVNGIGPNPTDVVFRWEARFYAYGAGATAWAPIGLNMPDIWPDDPWPDPPQGTFTLPAGQSSYNLRFNYWNIWYAYNPGTTYLATTGWPAGLFITSTVGPTYDLNLTYTGKGTASSPSSQYLAGQTCVCLATPEAGESVVKWIKDGIDYPPSATFTFTFASSPANVVCVFSGAARTVMGSYSSLGTNACSLSPYANLGSGNVLVQPRAFIFANGSSIANGDKVEVADGESVMIAVNTESIYTRIVSMVVTGLGECAGPGTNYASRDVSVLANTGIEVSVQVAADRFCYQTRPQTGPNDPPDAPIPPVPPPTDPTKPPSPPGDTPNPPGIDVPFPPGPPSPPPAPPPSPPEPPEGPPEGGDIDFILKDYRSGVELTKISGVYQARNTQWIQYVCTAGDPVYTWKFGDSSPDSSEVSPIHRYYFLGNNLFRVTLYAWAGSEQKSTSKLVRVVADELGSDPDPDPTTTNPEPTGTYSRPSADWPDLILSGAEILTLRWQDDRGKWSQERSISLSKPDPYIILHRLGKYRVRSWELVMAAGIPQVVAYMEEEVDICDD